MPSEESLRTLIGQKLRIGILPGKACTRVFGGAGNGEICDACGEAIATNQLVLECIGEHYPKTLQFHVQCFYIWDSERRTGNEPTCSSAPAS